MTNSSNHIAIRTLIDADPFTGLNEAWKDRGRWPADWITHHSANGSGPIVMALRCRFTVPNAQVILAHVSADERYELWLDGKRVGCGPERGDRLNWFFETYELHLTAGEHIVAACVWWLNEFGPAPFAQISLKPAFLLAAEGSAGKILSTGVAAWECAMLRPGQIIPPKMTWGTGAKLHIDTRCFTTGTDAGLTWSDARKVHYAFGASYLRDQPPLWVLTPATLPAMLDQPIHEGAARHVQAMQSIPTDDLPVHASDNLPDEADAWTSLLRHDKPLIIPAATTRRIIIDLDNYFTAYTDLSVSGGEGSSIRIWWAESLYETRSADNAYGTARIKGDRNQLEGKIFIGIGNTYEPDGSQQSFSSLWWEAGRYLQVIVQTVSQPLTIERLSFRETRYPWQWTSQFSSSDARLAEVIPLALRAIEMCSHETYMDCPYYEQLMYVGDTRLEVLASYTWCNDDRLPRKAIKLFDQSRRSPGFTQSRYPSRLQQIIPPFSAWWVAMLHDFMMWRGDRAFVAQRLAGMRAVLDAFTLWQREDGLYSGPVGWNFADWVTGWKSGMPPDADTSISAILNLQLAWVMRQAVELETYAGVAELAERYHRQSTALAGACHKAFWNPDRGIYADDLAHSHYSEHAQCLALLGDICPPDAVPHLVDQLLSATDLARTTVYFSHYLFEAMTKVGRIDRVFDRLGLWFDLKKDGLRTTIEQPEPTRSDCHAWGAHPIYHYQASILGIRPATPGCETIIVRPQLGPLQKASGSLYLPQGCISIELSVHNRQLRGTIDIPLEITGTLHVNGSTVSIMPGRTSF